MKRLVLLSLALLACPGPGSPPVPAARSNPPFECPRWTPALVRIPASPPGTKHMEGAAQGEVDLCSLAVQSGVHVIDALRETPAK